MLLLPRAPPAQCARPKIGNELLLEIAVRNIYVQIPAQILTALVSDVYVMTL